MRSLAFIHFIKLLAVHKDARCIDASFKVVLDSDEEIIDACLECVKESMHFSVKGHIITVWGPL